MTTYNWEEALALCLGSIAQQRVLPVDVVVADDGSREETGALVRRLAREFPVPLHHVWQPDAGFRAARVRNLGTARCTGTYVIYVDGDMVLHPDFIADHVRLARAGTYLQGGRLNASPGETRRLLAGAAPRFSPLMPGKYKRRHAIHWPWLAARKLARERGIVMSCNMGIWRADLDRVNGFDEDFEGWGREDDDLAARLRHVGVERRQLKFAGLAVHLWHRTRWPDGVPPTEEIPNDRLLRRTLETRAVRCARGLDRHVALFSGVHDAQTSLSAAQTAA
ncbi:glycosyltransferase family 2 protein [Lysobacter korlensis]|uniref:Glycosyltransferase family 2 protein n=1 Tax=Lysobacter korlensis TaxID=553636 RepID=A0ABV6RRC4_9GAMM